VKWESFLSFKKSYSNSQSLKLSLVVVVNWHHWKRQMLLQHCLSVHLLKLLDEMRCSLPESRSPCECQDPPVKVCSANCNQTVTDSGIGTQWCLIQRYNRRPHRTSFSQDYTIAAMLPAASCSCHCLLLDMEAESWYKVLDQVRCSSDEASNSPCM